MISQRLIAQMNDLATAAKRYLFKVPIVLPINNPFVARQSTAVTVLWWEGYPQLCEKAFGFALAASPDFSIHQVAKAGKRG